LIVGWRRDVEDGSYQTFTMKEFIYDNVSGKMEHMRYALVLYGAPRMAKTPFAKAMAAALACIHQTGGGEPYSLVMNTAEAMPRGSDPRIQPGVPIVFDDMRPGANRLGRAPHSLEDLKVLSDVPDGGDMAARYSDIHFARMMPRLFTSNDTCPHGFHPAFPIGLKDMSNAAVLALDNHTKALLKRFAFCHVTTCLIPEAARAAFGVASVADRAAAAAALFGGAHAIP
jgi:hypothetical protein